MGIIYFISVLLLVTAFILIKKTNKVLNVLSFTGITIVVLFCYNAFICYILTFVSIPTSLLNLSIVNIIFTSIMSGIIYRKKEIQKYSFDKFGAICIGIILVVTIFVSILNFGFPFNIKYETGDPAIHYMTSVLFANQDSLLNLNVDEVHDSFESRKIGSYVNSGIIMKCCSSFMDDISYYNIFIGFGIFILFMSGAMMYSTLEKFAKERSQKILALIVSLIYLLGYPLNSLLFGFEYLSLGILILEAIIHMIYYFEKEELKFPFYIIIFALLNFNVFCSYYMFVPFTYSGLWIYFCIYSKKHNKKIFCKKNIIILTVTLLLPFFLGFIYHITPQIYNIFHLDDWEALKNTFSFSSHLLNKGFTLYGYIYVNFYSNTLLLIPLVMYYIYRKIKEKDFFSCDIIVLIFLVGFIGILSLGIVFEKVSVYYVMKNYYALWILLMYMNFRSLMYIYESSKINKKLSYILVGFYVGVVVLNLLLVSAPLGKGPFNDYESIANVTEIFGVNKTIIKDRPIDYNLDEIELLRYAKENLDFENNSVEFMADSEQLYWQYSMFRYVNYDEFLDDPHYSGQDRLTLKAMTAYQKIGKVDYMVYFKRSGYFKRVQDIVFERGEVIYENAAGGIIKY